MRMWVVFMGVCAIAMSVVSLLLTLAGVYSSISPICGWIDFVGLLVIGVLALNSGLRNERSGQTDERD